MKCVDLVTMATLREEPQMTVSPVPVPCLSPVTTLPLDVPCHRNSTNLTPLSALIVPEVTQEKDVNGRNCSFHKIDSAVCSLCFVTVETIH